MIFVKFSGLLVLLVVTRVVESGIFRNGYHDDSNSWYKFHEVPRSWHEARKICMKEGGILVSPTDADSKMVIEMFANYTNTHDDSQPRVFVGVHATISSSVWNSIEGIHLSTIADYVNTYLVVPSESNCAVYEYEFLIPVDCSARYPYICHKPGSGTNVCGTTDTSYEFDARTGSCYKLHQNLESWTAAYEQCYAEKAHLVIIDNTTEIEVVRDILLKDSENTNLYSVGVVDWEKNGVWYSIHGQPLETLEAMQWDAGEPNGDDYNCGMIVSTSMKLTNRHCNNSNVKFICEKHV